MRTNVATELAPRPPTSPVQQWWVLTIRMVIPSLRNGEVVTLIAGSIMFTIGFYIPLKEMTGAATGMSSYAQFLTPMVVIVAITFAAVSAAFRSASDAGLGINRRFKTMPIPSLVPLASRMSASVYRCTVAMAVSLACGHVIGFRFHNGFWYLAAFCGLSLLVGIALSLLGDFIGISTENPEATTHLILLPQLIFGFLSVGVQPVERFPDWIQPFVRNQPVSQFVYALRALAGDTSPTVPAATWSVIGPALLWAIGIIVALIPLHARIAARRQ
ncbi:ABC transporter permease [Mycolicibacterium psychrotolerans]|uniref:Doxorubicin resistance ABC transporter permease DrrB n=1 Tax=Mycolicibacterium psychrotolerans TaxID=216929 RepID=A0A7I7MF78_9MYCO|nr:ABC transporter permease [Mycolicibacterium psychrotolerans]BBX70193.1 doxorubicin resistance ABC transporter permease DrrB [Mycolicibacterium psychrotolerans]